MTELKGYRIRVIVDYPIWTYSHKQAIEQAQRIAEKSHSACKVMSTKCILASEADNRKLFPEEIHV